MKTFDQTEIKFYMIITNRGVRRDIELLLLNFDFFLFFCVLFLFQRAHYSIQDLVIVHDIVLHVQKNN